jgi:hypothetical protein
VLPNRGTLAEAHVAALGPTARHASGCCRSDGEWRVPARFTGGRVDGRSARRELRVRAVRRRTMTARAPLVVERLEPTKELADLPSTRPPCKIRRSQPCLQPASYPGGHRTGCRSVTNAQLPRRSQNCGSCWPRLRARIQAIGVGGFTPLLVARGETQHAIRQAIAWRACCPRARRVAVATCCQLVKRAADSLGFFCRKCDIGHEARVMPAWLEVR